MQHRRAAARHLLGVWLASALVFAIADPLCCRVCSWHLTCKQLCESVGSECNTPWLEQQDDAFCKIVHLRPTPGARTLQGRMVHSETSYLVHKDVLADLVHRYTSVRRIRAHGGSLGSPTVFDELDAKALQNSISLCFPRVALAWQWLTGQRLPPSSTVCCHQECHWEEMFKRPHMPTLQELLAKAVEANEAALSKHSACGLPSTAAGIRVAGASLFMSGHCADTACASSQPDPEAPTETGAGVTETTTVTEAAEAEADEVALEAMGLDGMEQEQMAMHDQASTPEALPQQHKQATTHDAGQRTSCSYMGSSDPQRLRVVGWFLELAHGRLHVTLQGVLHAALWLLAPGLLVAHEAMEVAATTPWLALYVCVVATLRTIAEWRSAWFTFSSRHGSLRDKLMCTVSGFLIMGIVVVMVSGFVTSWLPLLAPPVASTVMWVHSLTMPLAATWFVYAVWGLQRRRGGGIGVAPWALLGGGYGSSSGSSNAAVAQQHAATHRHRGGGSQEGRVAAARQQGAGAMSNPMGTTHVVRTPAEAVAVVRMLGRQMAAGGGSGGFIAAYNRGMQATAEGAGGAAARAAGQAGGVAGGVGPGMGSRGIAQAPRVTLGAAGAQAVGSAAHVRLGRPAGGGAASAAAVVAAAGAGAAAAAAGGRAAGAAALEQSAAERQSAAAAALAAIHWPPPLEVPSWMEEECTVPDAFRCPITLSIMKEPTQASSGVTYERSAIFQWLHIHRVDPVTHVPLKRHRLTPNLNLRHMIEDWAVKRAAERVKKDDESGESDEGESGSGSGSGSGEGPAGGVGGASRAAAAQASGTDTP